MLVAAGWPVYVRPNLDVVSAQDPVDAVIALGGRTETAQLATAMVRRGEAGRAVLSNPYGPYSPAAAEMARLCPAKPLAGVICFVPYPATTRGEAQEIGRMARRYGWDDIAVIAPTFHISRARYITGRCYPGRLRMVDPDLHYGLPDWTYQYGYQTVGFLKAQVLRGC